MIYLTIILILLTQVCKAIQDKLLFHFDKSVFKSLSSNWWNPLLSSDNKYTWSDNKFIAYLLQTVLVWVTDAWHFFGMLRYLLMIIGISIFLPFVWWRSLLIGLSIYAIGRLIFHITFIHILKEK